MNKANRKDGFTPSAFGVDEIRKLAKVNKNGSFLQQKLKIIVFKLT